MRINMCAIHQGFHQRYDKLCECVVYFRISTDTAADDDYDVLYVIHFI